MRTKLNICLLTYFAYGIALSVFMFKVVSSGAASTIFVLGMTIFVLVALGPLQELNRFIDKHDKKTNQEGEQ
jgi:hypothetical protein